MGSVATKSSSRYIESVCVGFCRYLPGLIRQHDRSAEEAQRRDFAYSRGSRTEHLFWCVWILVRQWFWRLVSDHP